MRLGVRVYITRDGQALFLDQRNESGQPALQAPTHFVTDDEMLRSVAMRLVKEATGLTPTEIVSLGTVFLRSPVMVNRNLAIWTCRVHSAHAAEPPDAKHHWLAIEPEMAPEVPELDRLWLPLVVRRAQFTATINYNADGRGYHPLVRERRVEPP